MQLPAYMQGDVAEDRLSSTKLVNTFCNASTLPLILMQLLTIHLLCSKRIINLGPVPTPVSLRPPGMSRVVCAYCHEVFLVSVMHQPLSNKRSKFCQ